MGRGGDCEHFVMECGELQEIRIRYGVYRAKTLEEVLMFKEKNEEKVNQSMQEDAQRDV